MSKVSVVIATYNRFSFLLSTIKSIQEQTVKPHEIIVVNDKSTQPEYYTHSFKGVKIIHLPHNSRQVLGYPSPGYVRNQGIKLASGDYVAFCDDDDIWFPQKLELQLAHMKKLNCKMSCTEGLIGNGPFIEGTPYKKYNSEHCYDTLVKIYKRAKVVLKTFPPVFDLKLIQIHNIIICSSVIIDLSLIHI